jgi:hypothetical protein
LTHLVIRRRFIAQVGQQLWGGLNSLPRVANESAPNKSFKRERHRNGRANATQSLHRRAHCGAVPLILVLEDRKKSLVGLWFRPALSQSGNCSQSAKESSRLLDSGFFVGLGFGFVVSWLVRCPLAKIPARPLTSHSSGKPPQWAQECHFSFASLRPLRRFPLNSGVSAHEENTFRPISNAQR